MRNALAALALYLCSLMPAAAQISVGIGIGLPNVTIGINLPAYPQLVAVPGYPVYYAPQVSANYFFYDGMYWVFYNDNWYASAWYNGPWTFVAPDYVPLYVLRVPVRYYRAPPAYFRGWYASAPPRWNVHWGPTWSQAHSGWDRWDRHAVPPPAPLPVYQRSYSGNRYPHVEQQVTIQNQYYSYQPRDAAVRQSWQAQGVRPAPANTAPPPRAAQASPRPAPSQEYNRGSPQPNYNRGNPPASTYNAGSPPQDGNRGHRPPPQAMPAPSAPAQRAPAQSGSPGMHPQAGGPPQGRQQPMQAPPPGGGALPPRQPQQPPQKGGGQDHGHGGPPDKGGKGGKGDERGK